MAYGNINVPGVTGPELEEAIASKVDKVAGKGLSANDFTTAEKNKLQNIEPEANKYIHPAHAAQTLGLYAETIDNLGHVTSATPATKSDIGLGNVDNTSDANKPISAAVSNALSGKVDKVTGKGLSVNDFTTAEKNKLADLESPTCFTPTVTRYLPPDESVGYGCLTLSSERFKANYFYLFFLTDPLVVNPAKMPVFHPTRCAGGGTVVVYCENFNGGDSSKTPFLRAAGFKLN